MRKHKSSLVSPSTPKREVQTGNRFYSTDTQGCAYQETGPFADSANFVI